MTREARPAVAAERLAIEQPLSLQEITEATDPESPDARPSVADGADRAAFERAMTLSRSRACHHPLCCGAGLSWAVTVTSNIDVRHTPAAHARVRRRIVVSPWIDSFSD